GPARRPGTGPGAAAAAQGVTRAVVVGSGPNGLAAAIVLLEAGGEGEGREGAGTVGGRARSEELELPGLVHDGFATGLPLAVGSPSCRTLGRDVHWIHPDAPAAHPRDDGTAVLLERGVEETAEGLGRDGEAYRSLVEPLVEAWEEVAPVVLGKLPPPPR